MKKSEQKGQDVHPGGDCETCGGLRIVSVRWPSGYPHASPCPECRPSETCGCGAPGCPAPAAFKEWRKEKEQPMCCEVCGSEARDRMGCWNCGTLMCYGCALSNGMAMIFTDDDNAGTPHYTHQRCAACQEEENP